MFYFFFRFCLLILLKLRFFRKIVLELILKWANNIISTSLPFWKFFKNRAFWWFWNKLNFRFLSFNKLLPKGKLSIHSLLLLVLQLKDDPFILILFLLEWCFILSVAFLFQYILLRYLIILNSYIVSPNLSMNSW